jgi:ABC-type transporter Mla subunit MlaD
LVALEQPLQRVEDRLQDLGLALRQRDAVAVDRVASELHTALAAAVDHFAHAAKHGAGVPQVLRHRLAMAGGQVAAQREALARATASLDRAIEVLIPGTDPEVNALYSAGGNTARTSSRGGLLA